VETETGLGIFAWVLIIGGLIGAFLPFIPGVTLMFIGMAIIGWIGDFHRIGYGTLGILLVLMLIAHIIDYAAGAWGAKRMGASKGAIWGSVIGSVAGIFMGLVGILFMPFVGAVIGELLARGDVEKATKVGMGTWLGLAVGMACKVAIAFSMLGIFGLAYYFSAG
jgi:uncharacterized protein YqgC (DUF456 family)